MKIRHGLEHDNDIELNMTSMIDIVFQLLVFFIMTFKIVNQEGDFNVRMPAGPSAATSELSDPPVPLTIELAAFDRTDRDGMISKITVKEGLSEVSPPSGYSFWTTDALHAYCDKTYFQNRKSADAEAILKLHPRLKYSEVIAIISAISGKIDPDSGLLVKLFEKISFQPPD